MPEVALTSLALHNITQQKSVRMKKNLLPIISYFHLSLLFSQRKVALYTTETNLLQLPRLVTRYKYKKAYSIFNSRSLNVGCLQNLLLKCQVSLHFTTFALHITA